MGAEWIKINLGIYEDEKIKWVDTMSQNNLLQYLFLRFLVQAGRTNKRGRICMENGQPYSLNMLSVIFNRAKEEIEYALKVFYELGMITIDESGIIEIVNWVKHQNIEGMEKVRAQTKERVKKYRQKQQKNCDFKCNVTVTHKKREEIEKEEDKDTEIIERERKETEVSADNEKYVLEVIEYISTLSKPVKGSSRERIQKLIDIHGADNVKIALELASDNDIYSMDYVSGILNNWSNEGYPEETSYLSHKKKSLKFDNFKGREYDYDELEAKLLGN